MCENYDAKKEKAYELLSFIEDFQEEFMNLLGGCVFMINSCPIFLGESTYQHQGRLLKQQIKKLKNAGIYEWPAVLNRTEDPSKWQEFTGRMERLQKTLLSQTELRSKTDSVDGILQEMGNLLPGIEEVLLEYL